MPPRRAKSQSISSDAPTTASNTKMSPPPSPKAVTKPLKSAMKSSPVASRSSPVTTRSAPVVPSKSTLSSSIRFPLAALLTMSLSALLFELASNFTQGDLGSVSKHLETVPEITAVVGWRVVQLGVFWFSDFDAYDTAALAVLSNVPTFVLLLSFYVIRPSTVLVSFGISVATTTIPFILLRPSAPIHSSSPAAQRRIPRLTRSILTDPATTISTSLLATAIFAVVLEASFATWLPTFLVTHFDGLRSVEFAHRGAAGLPLLLVYLLPAGYAAREFLFVSSTASTPSSRDKKYAFDPRTATLGETAWHNVWGWYNAREKALIQRTILGLAMVSAETVFGVWGTIAGSEILGAMGYAGLWAAAIAVVGMAFSWVGGPSD